MADRPTYVWTGSAWDTIADPGAVRKALLTNKAALVTATAASTPATLTVGTDGQALLADSTQSTGLRWGSVTTTGEDDQIVLAVQVFG